MVVYYSIVMSGPIILCSKDGVTLWMSEVDGNIRFKINLSLDNENVNLKKIIGFNIFALIGSLNKDVLESVKVLNINQQFGKILMVLKPFGEEMGLSQKYICSSATIVWSNDGNTANIRSNQDQLPDDVVVSNDCEPVESSDSIIKAQFTGNHHADIIYDFSLVFEHTMPRFLRKMPGKMMFLSFLRVKEFIENMNVDIKG